jgi:hypothetical protein
MNTTISDLSKFTAVLVSGEGLSATSSAEMTKPQLHITVAHQFPLFQPDLPVSEQRKDLYAGLGVVVFDGPQGHGFYKGGHDATPACLMTGNTETTPESRELTVTLVGIRRDCFRIMGNSDTIREPSAKSGFR